ncbi:MAG: universal stress protein [Paludibacteraceae bacterium]|jgi:nucleotide-binding universal stress UspA family protein|nr:universal stress protein [Paludibacteraceae bacterium]MBO5862699.1 universal stress protein [Paludibacteraceae bacterium]MBO5988758.1 universal stress protein [Paludibacteraceae bacterium]
MEDRLVTVAIHTYEKAQILKSVLEANGVDASIHNVNQILPVVSAGVRVRIRESDLPKALSIIEEMNNAQAVQEAVAEELQKKPHEILVPVDFSDYSQRACAFAFSLAEKTEAEVVLLHSYMNFGASSSIGGVISYERTVDDEVRKANFERAEKEMLGFERQLREQIEMENLPNVKFSTKIREGIPEEEILHYVKRHAPMMIVMGTRGKSQKDMELIGSVTAEIVERAWVPVFAIPENTVIKSFNDIRNIACVTNFEDKDLIAFDKMMSILKPFKFKVHFVHFCQNSSENLWSEIKLSGIRTYFAKYYPELEFEYNVLKGNDLLSVLDDFVQENSIDVVSMNTHKRNIFARLFNHSIARKMVFHTDTAMFVFHS